MNKYNLTKYEKHDFEIDVISGGHIIVNVGLEDLTIQELRNLHEFIGEVLVDLGEQVSAPLKTLTEKQVAETAPMQNKFAPEVY